MSYQNTVPQYQQSKSWIATMLLCFFLGTFGIHNFYLGNRLRGICQLVLNGVGWLFSFILIGYPMLWLLWAWVLVEFVLIILRTGGYGSDSDGVPLR
ncbi:Putative membrane protein [Corynebacterium camporealensis]|uniref:Putative membrane protein n=1 Tax=Corynebacterium camporealensis TaxID=161896 RepID=A0A0F6QY68_9CORY|nr:TM2 domain-containing protein [Corynebacterium camporealensis]AKE39083.1 putative membrane protein [Corynebacterium camporealensis]AVH88307.1 Putative membrane protein [Corynebacterium camporealensis]